MSISIKDSVGRTGMNHKPDTRQVQTALSALFPAKPLVVDGLCGRNTIAHIEKFQRRFMQRPDGRVDPRGKTLRRLNSAAPTTSAAQDEWAGDSSKWSEAKKIRSLDRRMRIKVERVLRTLKSLGFKPRVVYAWRSVDVQRQLVAKGHSKVLFSFHNAQQVDGSPNAYAVDIIDRRWAWSPDAEANGFWDALGRAAKKERMFWGGDWQRFKDWAHIQYWQNNELAEIKRESGLA